MTTITETKKPRATWTQVAVATLVTHYQHGGIAAAEKALPDKARPDIDAKLVALGLLKMTENDHLSVGNAIKDIRSADNPSLAARAAIKTLREVAKEAD